VNIDEGQTVEDLKEAIKSRSDGAITAPWLMLQLFLAKKDRGAGDWLAENDVKGGATDTTGLKPLDAVQAEIGEVGLSADEVRLQVTKKHVADRKGPVHVLVAIPGDEVDVILHENVQHDGVSGAADEVERQARNELELYRRRGQEIRTKCFKYCEEVLAKLDHLFGFEPPIPFICVEGSSGMGKSQLAFALRGQRPWFYWLACQVGGNSQSLYSNFSSTATFPRYRHSLTPW